MYGVDLKEEKAWVFVEKESPIQLEVEGNSKWSWKVF